MRHVKTCSALLLTLLTLAATAAAQTARAASAGKPGGVLEPVLQEDLPQGFAIHESATNSVTWPAMPCYIDFAAFVVSEFKNVGVEATLKQIDTAQWHPMAIRREFLIGANLTGLGIDDPDANFYENYACGSPRNYGAYCNELVMGLIDKQSQETDPQKRMALVGDIQKKLEEDTARPIMGWRIDRFAHLPTVKNLVPHSVVYNCCRLQDSWLDK
jgi:hypothetical protein